MSRVKSFLLIMLATIFLVCSLPQISNAQSKSKINPAISSCPIGMNWCYVYGDPIPWQRWKNAANFCRSRHGDQSQLTNKPPTLWPWCIYPAPINPKYGA